MIVTPEFLDHWKTRLLVGELGGDELAPLYVIRLWGYCQTKKTHRLGRVSAGAIKAITRYTGAQENLWLALQNAGFLTVKAEQVSVHEWSDYNHGLLSAWANGKKGGRPKKNKEKPDDNRPVPKTKPKRNRNVTDKIGLDKIGLDKIGLEVFNPASAKPRERNDLLDSLASIGGGDPKQTPKARWSALQRVLTDIKTVSPDVTVEEIARRAKNYHELYPTITPTPEGLAKWWAMCGAKERTNAPIPKAIPAEPDGWRTWLNERFPDSKYSKDGVWEGTPWEQLPEYLRNQLIAGAPKPAHN